MTSVRVPGFLPSTRGLHFPNAFPHVPNFTIDLPGGHSIPVGDAANGCWRASTCRWGPRPT